jgi:hypothetical protein
VAVLMMMMMMVVVVVVVVVTMTRMKSRLLRNSFCDNKFTLLVTLTHHLCKD